MTVCFCEFCMKQLLLLLVGALSFECVSLVGQTYAARPRSVYSIRKISHGQVSANPVCKADVICVPDIIPVTYGIPAPAPKKTLQLVVPGNYNCFKKTGGVQMAAQHVSKFPKQYISPVISRLEIPASFDARSFWPKCNTIKQIRNQGECACCWAEAVTEALSDRICISSAYQDKNIQLSVQDLIQCCDGCATCGSGCRGGLTELAYDQYVRNGIVSGSEFGQTEAAGGCSAFQYNPNVSDTTQSNVRQPVTCSKQCDPNSGKNYANDKNFGQGWYMITDVQADGSFDIKATERKMQLEILMNGSITVNIVVYKDFYAYKQGVYSHADNRVDFTGFHSLKVIGWGFDGAAYTPYWLVANSWGPSWGDQGVGKILRGSNSTGIESRASAATPKAAAPVATAYPSPSNSYAAEPSVADPRAAFIRSMDQILASFDVPISTFYSCDQATGTEYRSSW